MDSLCVYLPDCELNWIDSRCLTILVANPNTLVILIIEFYQTLFFLSFNHIFLYFIGAFDVFLFSFSRWNDNLCYTTISVTKLDDINELGIKLGIDLLGHAYSSEHVHYFDLELDFGPLS